MALQTSPESPAPVRQVANLIGQWIGRLGAIWVEGQVAQLTRRPGTSTVFLTLRDPVADISVQVTCPRRVFDIVDPPVVEGARVLVHARPAYYAPRGTLSLAASDIRPVGLGDLLARLERRKRLLAAEGLFARERKRPLPFLPTRIGLVCGRNSAAEHDLLENTRRRWAAARFRVENVAVQGPQSAGQVMEALRRLDADTTVDVIVVARGGGSVEDLLPFSDEGLIRAVADCRTPVVSAIGHEQDSPLLDLVADVRASTPTDAARRIVPDVGEETARVEALRGRARQLFGGWLDRELTGLHTLRARSALGDPERDLGRRAEQIVALRDRADRCVGQLLDRADDNLHHQLARVRALSPKATLDRGYAVVQKADGHAVRDPAEVSGGELLAARVAGGQFSVRVQDADGAPDAAAEPGSQAQAEPESARATGAGR
ncbi:exodeoxyribonuclease VII large subunit [Actinopolymorpha cephalotaxi]|uniref:Exodeoxyribonuclease 7 large subunit n=1 Tax=Actinopolymorpha cephalotaxi TaxID=504797 RepID=A0A1I2YUU6_9ACTN|nr:exodeoxyribonuclease VII large subunit [Actinopolymorpha cephalotaxi]NYH81706.1 exodeoxyribonuclease VII large subunit [Actinopolymorpha cephalotaxi]SFH29384.1 exodeoxyribonuclease VII large subunit [Actinopolymorpha cephalotaxi]